LTVSAMLPAPEAAQVEPDVATQVQVAPVIEAGMPSATVALVTADGPLLVTTIVYEIGVPGTAASAPSVLVMDRSAVMMSVSVSVAELLSAIGSVVPAGTAMVAVLINEPVAPCAMFAVRV
jgi:hypothetical protein